MNNLDKIIELIDEETSNEEQEQMRKDTELFIKLLPIFENMSNRGKKVTVETLIMCLLEEV